MAMEEPLPLGLDFRQPVRRAVLLGQEAVGLLIAPERLGGGVEAHVPPEFVGDVLEADVEAMEERHRVGALIFAQAGTYAPTLGVLGAVVGLIAALGNLNDIDKLGHSIAAAFVATLLGIFSGYVLWHPFASSPCSSANFNALGPG
jgi:chemotaxis protein MotA